MLCNYLISKNIHQSTPTKQKLYFNLITLIFVLLIKHDFSFKEEGRAGPGRPLDPPLMGEYYHYFLVISYFVIYNKNSTRLKFHFFMCLLSLFHRFKPSLRSQSTFSSNYSVPEMSLNATISPIDTKAQPRILLRGSYATHLPE